MNSIVEFTDKYETFGVLVLLMHTTKLTYQYMLNVKVSQL